MSTGTLEAADFVANQGWACTKLGFPTLTETRRWGDLEHRALEPQPGAVDRKNLDQRTRSVSAAQALETVASHKALKNLN